MFKKWLRYLWPDAYIVFTQSQEGLNATQYVINGTQVEVIDESSFAIDDNTLSKEAKEYIAEFISVYPQTQLVFLTAAASCSAIAGCSKADLVAFDVDTSIIKHVCKGSFSSYISIMDLESDQLLFKPYELDYIFSPFFILDAVRTPFVGTQMVCLHRQDRLYIAMYSDDKLVYGDNITIGGGGFEDDLDDDSEQEDDDFDLDGMDGFDDAMDGFDELDDLDDLEDMDELEDMDDMDDTDSQEDSNSINEEDMHDVSELKEYDLHIYEAIKNAINNFYHDEKVQSDFVQEIQIIDTLSLSKNVYDLIEDELFCEVQPHNIDLHKECLNLVLKEKS